MDNIKQVITDILDGNSALTIDEIITSILVPSNHTYHSGDDESPISDAEYDQLFQLCKSQAKSNSFFLGVGSDVRGGKVDLPYPMGSLNQLQADEIINWVVTNDLNIENVTLTEKLDGISCLLIYDHNGEFQIAYSRGNGFKGADITRHLKSIKSFPKKINLSNAAIRTEVLFPKHVLAKIQKLVKSKSNREYKNLRNMIAGIMNSKTTIEEVYNEIDVVAFEVINKNYDKKEQLSTLSSEGFKTAEVKIVRGNELSAEMLNAEIARLKKSGRYEIDGVVVDVDSSVLRTQMCPTTDTLNPAFAIKYKVVDESSVKHAEVLNVEWNISKHGYLKPKIVLKAFDLNGVTIQHATGFNAKFICDNNIGNGAIVEIVRSGDVIPFCRNVIKGGEVNLPQIGHKWNDTEVDFILTGDNVEVNIQQLIDFATSMEINGLREGSVRKLVKAYNIVDCIELLMLTEDQLVREIGTNGSKIFDSIKLVLSDCPLWKFMGSVSLFGRGIGKRKIKKLLATANYENYKDWTVESISTIESFDAITAEKIISNIEEFNNLLIRLQNYAVLVMDVSSNSDGKFSGKKICFTGFRDKELQNRVEEMGGTIQSAFSGKTDIVVTVDVNGKSSKLTKARDAGIRIISKQELEEMLNDL